MTIDDEYDSYMGGTRTAERDTRRTDEPDFENTELVLPGTHAVDHISEALGRAATMRRPSRNELIKQARELGELLAEEAYFSYPAGGERIEGATIDLIEGLQGVYGGIISSVRFISQPREDRIHLRAVAVDLVTFTATEREHIGFLAPARRGWAKNEENRARWETMQMQSQASRASRNAIERRLPRWLVRAAEDAARAAVADDIFAIVVKDEETGKMVRTGKRRTLSEAREFSADATTKKWGLTRAELENYFGMPIQLWTVEEVRQLRDLYKQLAEGKLAVEAVRSAGTGEAAAKEASKAPKTGDGVDDPPEPEGKKEPAKEPAPAAPAKEEPKVSPEAEKLLVAIDEWESTLGKERVKAIRDFEKIGRLDPRNTARLTSYLAALKAAGVKTDVPKVVPLTVETKGAILQVEEGMAQGAVDEARFAMSAATGKAKLGDLTEDEGLAYLAALRART